MVLQACHVCGAILTHDYFVPCCLLFYHVHEHNSLGSPGNVLGCRINFAAMMKDPLLINYLTNVNN